MTETEQQAARDQRARFEALAYVVTEPLHRYLLRRADADQVDDILSETLLVLWRRIEDVPGLEASGRVPDPDAVLPWCYGGWRGSSPPPPSRATVSARPGRPPCCCR